MEFAIDSARRADKHFVGVMVSRLADFNALVALFCAIEVLAIHFGPLSILIDEAALEAGLIVPTRSGGGHFNGSRVAVFPPDLMPFGLNRMFQLIGGDKTEPYFGVYRTRADGELWLLPRALRAPE